MNLVLAVIVVLVVPAAFVGLTCYRWGHSIGYWQGRAYEAKAWSALVKTLYGPASSNREDGNP